MGAARVIFAWLIRECLERRRCIWSGALPLVGNERPFCAFSDGDCGAQDGKASPVGATIRANTEPGETGMDANNSARALAALALSMATVQRLVFAKTLSRQDAVDLADGALVIIENIAHEFPDDVQRGARAILAETQTAFSRLPSL
jgi:hypothetical protein